MVWGDNELRLKSEAAVVVDFLLDVDCSEDLVGVCFAVFSAAFKAKASLPSVNEFRYSLKKCLLTDSGALVNVSPDILFTNHAEYPRPFSTSHLKFFPLNRPNCTSNWPKTSLRSLQFPPSRFTSALALLSTSSDLFDTYERSTRELVMNILKQYTVIVEAHDVIRTYKFIHFRLSTKIANLLLLREELLFHETSRRIENNTALLRHSSALSHALRFGKIWKDLEISMDVIGQHLDGLYTDWLTFGNLTSNIGEYLAQGWHANSWSVPNFFIPSTTVDEIPQPSTSVVNSTNKKGLTEPKLGATRFKNVWMWGIQHFCLSIIRFEIRALLCTVFRFQTFCYFLKNRRFLLMIVYIVSN